ncbi:MAG: type II toxin-antitoxin system RelE/ParE family toxin [Deltaproteobacteria bacterium]|nr:type II toxin-antitoxin system RelE/ParE family toxin [Deltaproteobacteria bacterium]
MFYQEEAGTAPLLEWFAGLPRKAVVKCRVRIERLRELGHELRRPEADYLRDEVYEMRVSRQGINYRMLYFFHGETAAVVSHGITKERVVPPREIDLAVARKRKFSHDPKRHTHKEM